MTWFVISLFFLYVFYFVGRSLRLDNKVFDGWVFVLSSLLALVLVKAGISGTSFESNYAFLCGILFKQCEEKILSLKRGYASVLCLIILAAVSMSYIPNVPPFRGFALMGVVAYVMAFFFVLSFIPFRVIPFVRFFKSISYEMYLCQGIFFLALPYLHLPWYTFVVLLLVGDMVCAWLCQKLVDVAQGKH